MDYVGLNQPFPTINILTFTHHYIFNFKQQGTKIRCSNRILQYLSVSSGVSHSHFQSDYLGSARKDIMQWKLSMVEMLFCWDLNWLL